MFISILGILLLSLAAGNLATADELTDLQWAICEDRPQSLARMLNLEAAEPRKQTYFESADQRLRELGIYLKSSLIGGQRTFDVKMVTDMSDQELVCENDRYGDRIRRKCSLESKGRWFSSKQREWVESAAGWVDWSNLESRGPYLEKRWKGTWKGRKIKMESLMVPDQQPVSEFSIKISAEKSDAVYSEFSDFLIRKKIGVCTLQQGKADRLFSRTKSF